MLRYHSAGLPLCLILSFFLRVPLVFAAGTRLTPDRSFSGFYEITGVQPQNGRVRLRLAIRLFNYSSLDVSNAKLTFADPTLPGRILNSIPVQSIRKRTSVRVNGNVSVPAVDYRNWRQRTRPRVILDYVDSAGRRHLQPVELAPSPPVGRR